MRRTPGKPSQLEPNAALPLLVEGRHPTGLICPDCGGVMSVEVVGRHYLHLTCRETRASAAVEIEVLTPTLTTPGASTVYGRRPGTPGGARRGQGSLELPEEGIRGGAQSSPVPTDWRRVSVITTVSSSAGSRGLATYVSNPA